MQITGMLYGSQLLKHVDFPATEVLGPGASEDEIQGLIDRHKLIFIKPLFRGGVGKKGKAGLVGRAGDLKTALREKERLYFVEHRVGIFLPRPTASPSRPACRPSTKCISPSRLHRIPRPDHDADAPRRHRHRGARQGRHRAGAVRAADRAESLRGRQCALATLVRRSEIISPLVQHLPKLWELIHYYGMTTLELNPIRMRPGRDGRLTPVACDFKCGFDRDDPRWQRPGPAGPPVRRRLLRTSSTEINQLRTYQGQSRRLRHQRARHHPRRPPSAAAPIRWSPKMLGDDAIISSDFGGNPPYEKMKEVARICFKHWLKQTNVLFIIGGKSNNTDIFDTFRAMADALREHFSAHGATPLYVVVGRGGPNLVRGMGSLRGDARQPRPAVPVFRLRQRDLRGRQLRQAGRRLDAERRPCRHRGKARHRRRRRDGRRRTAGGAVNVQEGHRGLRLLSRHQFAGRGGGQ